MAIWIKFKTEYPVLGVLLRVEFDNLVHSSREDVRRLHGADAFTRATLILEESVKLLEALQGWGEIDGWTLTRGATSNICEISRNGEGYTTDWPTPAMSVVLTILKALNVIVEQETPEEITAPSTPRRRTLLLGDPELRGNPLPAESSASAPPQEPRGPEAASREAAAEGAAINEADIPEIWIDIDDDDWEEDDWAENGP